MVNLILFLLVTVAYLIPVVEVHARLPSQSYCAGGCDEALGLHVVATERGFVVSDAGAILAPGCAETRAGATTVPRRDGALDYEGLTACMGRVKAAHPAARQVNVSADPQIPYEDVIGILDAVRSDGPRVLFDDVLLSAGTR